MPANHGIRLNDDQSIAPPSPQRTQRHPEQAVPTPEARPRPVAFEYGDLLSRRQNLQAQIMAGAKETAHVREQCGKKLEHLAGWGNTCASPKSARSRRDRISAFRNVKSVQDLGRVHPRTVPS